MSKPIAVLISDVHYSVPTLEVADAAMRKAIQHANELDVPLIVAGDLHDTKANMRAECVNAMLRTFSECETSAIILRGNHCSINERSTVSALSFLVDLALIVETPIAYNMPNIRKTLELIPYHHDPEELKTYLGALPKGSTLIMHQGVQGSDMGDYIQDKSALPKERFADFRVISGHYHNRQDILCGKPKENLVGLFSYIGNPYTLSFGEANDPQKGFQVLMDDGSLEFVPTNLRRHHVYETFAQDLGSRPTVAYNPGDLLRVKVSGTKDQLLRLSREQVTKALALDDMPYRLDFIPLDTVIKREDHKNKPAQDAELMDELIDSMTNTSDERKTALKALWRAAICE